jgi:hypothetical protein
MGIFLRLHSGTAAAGLAVVIGAIAHAGEKIPDRARSAALPSHVIATFARRVQPLVLNKCGAGACHGGPTAHEPRFARGDTAGRIDRRTTLTNIDALLAAVGPDGDTRTFLSRFAVQHPTRPAKPQLIAPPLSSRDRETLEGWVASARAGSRPSRIDPAVRPAAAEVPVKPRNPFRDLLDHGGPAPDLAPPPPVQPRAEFTARLDLRTEPAAGDVTPADDPRSPPPGTADSRRADRGAAPSPGPSARESR